MGKRRKSREIALQLLFQLESNSETAPKEIQRRFYENFKINEDVQQFSTILFEGVMANQKEIDQLIEESSEHWRLSRMSAIDRNILRIAIFEILNCQDIPSIISINEAIEIGKRYGTAESPAFINGILDKIIKKECKKDKE